MRLIHAARDAGRRAPVVLATLMVALTAAGCATQTEQMRAAADLGANEGLRSLVEQRRAQSVDHATQDAAVVLRSERPFLGTHSTARDVRAELPEVFRREITLRFAGRTNIATVAERVTEVTGLLVRVTPDVYQTSGSAASPASNAGVPGMPAPASISGQFAGGALALAAASSDALNDIRMDFYGGRLDRFLDTVAARTGLYWEYRDNAIVISRLMTRMFRLNSPPGNQQFDSSIGRQGQGQTTGGGAQQAFTSSTSVRSEARYSFWESLEQGVRGLLSPLGRTSVSQATGTVVVTDTRDAIDRIKVYIEAENAIASRQASFRVDVISVRLNDSAEFGINWDAVFTSLNRIYGVNLTSPSTLASSTAGSLGVAVLQGGSQTSQQFAGTSSYGSAALSDSTTVTTLNRVAVTAQPRTNTKAYLARTTPGQSSSAAGGTPGAPGLEPGSITTGFLLNLLPTITDANRIMLRFSLGVSDLISLNTQTSGTGVNQQSIQVPETSSSDFMSNVVLRPGESLMIGGYERNGDDYQRRTLNESAPIGVGGSARGSRTREAVIILISPSLLPGGNV